MFKGKKNKNTSKPNSQNKEEQAVTQNPSNPGFANKRKGQINED